MTTGIYLLVFKTGLYIGQARDCERRWQQHRADLLQGKHTKRLQQAYRDSANTLPETQILLECHPDLLNHYEAIFIAECKPQLNSVRPDAPTNIQDFFLWADCANQLWGWADVIPWAMSTQRRVDELEQSVRKLQAMIDAWDETEEQHLRRSAKIDAVYADRDYYKQRVQKLEAWQFRVKKLSWWQRVWGVD
jgi:hypothetical protein